MSDVTDLAIWRCEECGSPLMATPSGSVCPNGHGGLHSKMPTMVKRINHAVIAGIQNLSNKWGKYYLPDGAPVERIKQVNRELLPCEISDHALEGHKIWKIRRL